jgi:hypothetical protein
MVSRLMRSMVMVILGMPAATILTFEAARPSNSTRVLRRFNAATDMALQHSLQQHRASTNPAVPPREAGQ